MIGLRVRALRGRAAIVALAVVGLLAAGTTGASAVWTVQQQTSSTASTASLGLSQTWLSGSSLDHANEVVPVFDRDARYRDDPVAAFESGFVRG